MASKKFIEAKEFSDEDLLNELNETKSQYSKLKFEHSVKGIENPLILRGIRRDVARLQTEVRRREIGALSTEEAAKRSKIRLRRRHS